MKRFATSLGDWLHVSRQDGSATVYRVMEELLAASGDPAGGRTGARERSDRCPENGRTPAENPRIGAQSNRPETPKRPTIDPF